MTDSELEDFGQQIADASEAFLLGLRAISRARTTAAPPCRCCCSRSASCCWPVLGSALSATSSPRAEYQPDVGPDADLDAMRLRLADKLGELDTYAHNFEPYDLETVAVAHLRRPHPDRHRHRQRPAALPGR